MTDACVPDRFARWTPVPTAHVFDIPAAFAEFEVDLLRLRTREGMAIGKAKGRLNDRAPKLSAARQAHLLELHDAGEHTFAEPFEVPRQTVYRVLERATWAAA